MLDRVNITQTMDNYGHVLPGMQYATASAMGGTLS
jgi:hypothetical protein